MFTRVENSLALQEKALNLRAFRQQILAGNIANADTPNYKARDFDFSAALNAALAGRAEGALPLQTTAAGHLSGVSAPVPARLMYRTPVQDSVDGNTVEMDVERAQFAENAVRYESGLSFMTHYVKSMLSAVQS